MCIFCSSFNLAKTMCLNFCSCSVITKGIVAANFVCVYLNPSDTGKVQHAHENYEDDW